MIDSRLISMFDARELELVIADSVERDEQMTRRTWSCLVSSLELQQDRDNSVSQTQGSELLAKSRHFDP